ncbi:membrane protein [Lysobacter tyrosinilyticus]
MSAALRPFQRPRLWLGLWLCAIAAVIVLSLTPPPPMKVPHNFDKVEHLSSYALLAYGAVLLFARRRTQLGAGLALVAMGIGLEFAQAALTRDRIADPADALANATGVVLGLLMSFTAAARWLQRLDARLH